MQGGQLNFILWATRQNFLSVVLLLNFSLNYGLLVLQLICDIILFYSFGLGGHICHIQDLFLALCSGFTLDRAQSTI